MAWNEYSASIVHTEKEYIRILEEAASSGHLKVVERVVETWKISNREFYKQLSGAQQKAKAKGHLNIVQFLTREETGPQKTEEANELITAIVEGDVEIVEILLVRGVDVNWPCSNLSLGSSSSGLHPYKITAIIRLLLLHGADIRNLITENRSPLYAALATTKKQGNRTQEDLAFLLCAAGVDGQSMQFSHTQYRYSMSNRVPGIQRHNIGWSQNLYGHVNDITEISRNIHKIHTELNNNNKSSLVNLCRENIRLYLLNYKGGNNNNLIIAVQKLPLPQRLKKFLLFDIDISEWAVHRTETVTQCSKIEEIPERHAVQLPKCTLL